MSLDKSTGKHYNSFFGDSLSHFQAPLPILPLFSLHPNRINPSPKSHVSWPCSAHTHSNYSRSSLTQETHKHMHTVAQTRSCAPLSTSSLFNATQTHSTAASMHTQTQNTAKRHIHACTHQSLAILPHILT